MSGGSYDYAFYKIEDLAAAIDRNSSTPLRKAFAAHLMKVAEAAKAIEWNDSGDGDSREDELIRSCVGPFAELEQATAAAIKAKADLESVISTSTPSK